jgi:hypothetical protein
MGFNSAFKGLTQQNYGLFSAVSYLLTEVLFYHYLRTCEDFKRTLPHEITSIEINLSLN